MVQPVDRDPEPARSEIARDAAALIAHELRRPLSVILGYASMLGDGSLGRVGRRQREAVTKIARQGRDLGALLDALITSLGGQTNRSVIDLRAVAHQAVERIRDQADLDASHISISGTGHEQGAVLVVADPADVLCILTSLLHNALTYSPWPAYVDVELRGDQTVEVAVRDHGFGIGETDRRSLFVPKGRQVAGTGGFGLGLALSRKMAEHNGGTLHLEWSEVGKGSTFVLALPRAEQDPWRPTG
jgi:signal transduction histidine kinase